MRFLSIFVDIRKRVLLKVKNLLRYCANKLFSRKYHEEYSTILFFIDVIEVTSYTQKCPGIFFYKILIFKLFTKVDPAKCTILLNDCALLSEVQG